MPVMLADKHIGNDVEDGRGIDGKVFAREVFELDKGRPKEITIYWNSQGGNVDDAFDMVNALSVAKTTTRSIIYGWAYSSAGWAAMAADKVAIVDFGTWMCHMPYNPNNPDQQSQFLSMVADSVATIIANKSGRNGKAKKTPEEIKNMMLSTTYYNAQQMYDDGLVDEVLSSADYSVILNKEEIPAYEECRVVLNKFIQNKYNNQIPSTMAFEKVTNRLGLAAGSSEEAVINKIADMENSITAFERKLAAANKAEQAANDSKEEMARKLKEAQNAKDQACATYDSLKNEYDAMTEDCKNLKATNKELTESNAAMRAEKEKAENEAKVVAENALKEKVANLLSKYKTSGKINEKNEKVYEAMAIENYERTEVLLESMATNFSAPKTMASNSASSTDKPLTPADFRAFKAKQSSNA